MRTRLPIPQNGKWSPEYQRQLNGELERALERLNEYALVPYGGTEGQVLVKSSDRPYVMEWADSCCDGDDGSESGAGTVTFVGHAGERCAADSTTLDIATDFPSAQAGDFVLWVVYTQKNQRQGPSSANARVVAPDGWEIFAMNGESWMNSSFDAGMTPTILYKFLEEADVTDTFTATTDNANIVEMCSQAICYRGVSTVAPFMSPTHQNCTGTYNWHFANPVDIIANSAIVQITSRATSSDTTPETPLLLADRFGPDVTLDVDTEFGVLGVAGNYATKQHWLGAWTAPVAQDENWIPSETDTSSLGEFTPTGLSHSQVSSYHCTLTASGTGRHYTEFEVDLVDGEDYTFAVFFQSVSNSGSRGIAVTYVDPSNNERGAAVWQTTASSIGLGATYDDLADRGTVWDRGYFLPQSDGLPFTSGGWLYLHITAQETGTHKLRVNNARTSSSTLAGLSFTAASSDRAYVQHACFRRGHHAPYRVLTPTGAVTDGTGTYNARAGAFGWRTFGAGGTPVSVVIALNPELERYPLMRIMHGTLQVDELVPVTGSPLLAQQDRYYGGTGSQLGAHFISRPLMPTIDGDPAKYYAEIEVITDSASPLVVGVTPMWLSMAGMEGYSGAPLYSYTVNTAVNDVIGISVDFDAKEVKFYRNGTLAQTTAMTDTYPLTGIWTATMPMVLAGYTMSTYASYANVYEWKLKEENFTYPIPTGFVEADYLGDPTVTPGGGEDIIVDTGSANDPWKPTVRVASTADVPLASGIAGYTIDGVVLVAGDRVLLKDQTTATQNGIYVVDDVDPLTRATDCDSGAEMVGAVVFVNEGTANADTAWACTTNAPLLLGSTNIVWEAFGGGGSSAAEDVTYDNTDSELDATDVQAAVDELALRTNARGGAMQFVGEAVVSGAAATSLTISGLNLSADDTYFIEFAVDNGSGSTTNVSMTFNGDTTAANYDTEYHVANGTLDGSTGANNAVMVSGATAGLQWSGHGFLRHNFDGRPAYEGITNYTNNGVRSHHTVSLTHRTVGNVTSITFTSSVASALSIGTYIRVYRIGRKYAAGGTGQGGAAMEYVGETAVSGSAATDMTISGLDLTTDECYEILIVTKNAVGSTITPSLFYNGDTTASNYHTQFVTGNNTTVSGSRQNTASLGGYLTTENYMVRGTLTRDVDGSPRFVYQASRGPGSASISIQGFHIRNNTANVTSLTFSSSVASGLAVGSFVRVWRMKKVIDQTLPQTSDLVITSNASYQDTQLSIALTAGTYSVSAFIPLSVHATPDMNIQLNYTGTVTDAWSGVNIHNTNTNTAFMTHSTSMPHGVGMTSTAAYIIYWEATIEVSTSGTLSIQAKQVTSSATSVTFKKGARMRVRRIA